MPTQAKLMTAEELLLLPDDDMEHELIRGEHRTMPPPGFRHEAIVAKAIVQLMPFVKAHKLGMVVAGPGFRLERGPDTVRAPDFAFISNERLPPEGALPPGYLDHAPDLLAEVVSPSDGAGDLQEKIAQWLTAGARMVLALYPATRSIAVHRPGRDIRLLGPDDEFDGEDVLPHFACPARDFFPS